MALVELLCGQLVCLHAGLDVGEALAATGVAIVVDEVARDGTGLIVQNIGVLSVSPVSVVYVLISNTLVAYATDYTTGRPASDVVITIIAAERPVRICGCVVPGPRCLLPSFHACLLAPSSAHSPVPHSTAERMPAVNTRAHPRLHRAHQLCRAP